MAERREQQAALLWCSGENWFALLMMYWVVLQDQYYTYTMFDVCGLWAVKLMQGEIDLPDADTMDR